MERLSRKVCAGARGCPIRKVLSSYSFTSVQGKLRQENRHEFNITRLLRETLSQKTSKRNYLFNLLLKNNKIKPQFSNYQILDSTVVLDRNEIVVIFKIALLRFNLHPLKLRLHSSHCSDQWCLLYLKLYIHPHCLLSPDRIPCA